MYRCFRRFLLYFSLWGFKYEIEKWCFSDCDWSQGARLNYWSAVNALTHKSLQMSAFWFAPRWYDSGTTLSSIMKGSSFQPVVIATSVIYIYMHSLIRALLKIPLCCLDGIRSLSHFIWNGGNTQHDHSNQPNCYITLGQKCKTGSFGDRRHHHT